MRATAVSLLLICLSAALALSAAFSLRPAARVLDGPAPLFPSPLVRLRRVSSPLLSTAPLAGIRRRLGGAAGRSRLSAKPDWWPDAIPFPEGGEDGEGWSIPIPSLPQPQAVPIPIAIPVPAQQPRDWRDDDKWGAPYPPYSPY
ncbi:unnamed protein product [Vitrella brassicaformis CCMP3155]|uniref:Uncharacterized protein n=2 Tax=Vitrella brassicaformis TaxID=1169539 RepID=A0A0G4GB02_VITBC|nr:unnamed protein product [Vitrella brassicaformis CCMP3155]|mmetsp:Transcript_2046/g.4583  ORF Transcript_2046/g.4583 Transcript_2046/m.4583 type:complete len:144 (+) Transcript_2046:251-682(+)|eukprot:CEM26320.1 unnamed protein product [Vitrella brassicaformis CCMP3155]